MGDALMKRFLKRYCLKPDGSTGSSSLWGVSTRTQGVAPSSDQHFYRRNKNFRATAITKTEIQQLLYEYFYAMRFDPTGDTRWWKRVLHDMIHTTKCEISQTLSSIKKRKRQQLDKTYWGYKERWRTETQTHLYFIALSFSSRLQFLLWWLQKEQ